MTIPTYRDAFTQFLAAQQAAVKFTDPNFTHSAITRERAKRLQAARDTLQINARGYGITQQTGDPAAAIEEAFEGIQARDADSVAVANNEWAKVRTMLDAGRELGQIIDNSDRRRLSAILDRVEELALDSGDVEGVAAEVKDRVLGRLAEIGDPKAVTALQVREQARYGDTWDRVIEEATSGAVSVDARSALLNVSSEDYDATFGLDDPEWPEVEQAVANLDRLAPTLIQEAASD